MQVYANDAANATPGAQRGYGFRKACEAVKAKVPITDVAFRYVGLRRAGNTLRGRCPLHRGDNPDAFAVWPDDGRWHCFRCGIGGDVIDLHFHCGDFGELWEAMMDLAVEYQVELPERPKSWHDWQREKSAIRDVAAEARKEVRRRRLFKILVLSAPELQAIEDPHERRKEIRRAWRVFSSGMRRIGQ